LGKIVAAQRNAMTAWRAAVYKVKNDFDVLLKISIASNHHTKKCDGIMQSDHHYPLQTPCALFCTALFR
jgi:hypothetical protein